MKLLKSAAALMLCLLLLAGCGSSEAIAEPSEIAAQLKSYSSESANWVEIEKTKLSSYFGFSEEILSDFSVHINSSEEYFDMIAVFKLSDTSSRDDVMKGISFMATNTEANYKIASEAQSDKITNKIVAEVRDTVILCVIDNYSQIKEYLTEELGADILS